MLRAGAVVVLSRRMVRVRVVVLLAEEERRTEEELPLLCTDEADPFLSEVDEDCLERLL